MRSRANLKKACMLHCNRAKSDWLTEEETGLSEMLLWAPALSSMPKRQLQGYVLYVWGLWKSLLAHSCPVRVLRSLTHSKSFNPCVNSAPNADINPLFGNAAAECPFQISVLETFKSFPRLYWLLLIITGGDRDLESVQKLILHKLIAHMKWLRIEALNSR